MTDDTDDADPLEARLTTWARGEINTVAATPVPEFRTTAHRRFWRLLWVAAGTVILATAVTLGIVLPGSRSPSTRTGGAPAVSTRPAQATGRSTPSGTRTRQGSGVPPTGVPSPPAPPFGYCGGLRTVADARYVTEGGEAVAFVAATVDGSGSAQVGGSQLAPVSDVRVLAGTLSRGPLTVISEFSPRRGRYLFAVGAGPSTGDYFVSLGLYGSFQVVGTRAYRSCVDYDGTPPHRVVTGITTVTGLTRIFAGALHQ